ncbi:MAG TPA: nucleotidyl transferase AbiEii/AbiGii toxin family protein [Anaerolineae bacterium]|nr:nucleotidyl transferase AbiEii/AbiGii toxin family protein [Anaerolineae bacterium]HQI84909.1 nucleotidyl transferase AbiEii/AbiGii toxin family protein [Anaerolineae bacterium]
MIGDYATPQAFRSALEARLRLMAQQRGIDLRRLYRWVAFERLLARLFAQAAPPWVLKGGYALELRFDDRARATLDVDLSVPDPAEWAQEAGADTRTSWAALCYEHLQQVTAQPLNDGFEFRLAQPELEQTGAPGGGLRCAVEARLAGRTFARFHLDLGLGDTIAAPPEWIQLHGLLEFAGIAAPRIALYPVEQQFAEKVHAYTFPWRDRENTRVKDLADLVLLITSGMLDALRVRTALHATFETRGTHALPDDLPSPPRGWAAAYAALAQEFALPAATLDEAYGLVCNYWQEHKFSQ